MTQNPPPPLTTKEANHASYVYVNGSVVSSLAVEMEELGHGSMDENSMAYCSAYQLTDDAATGNYTTDEDVCILPQPSYVNFQVVNGAEGQRFRGATRQRNIVMEQCPAYESCKLPND